MNKRSVSHVPSRLAGLLFSVFLLMSLCSSVSAQEISCTDPNWIIISKTDALIESQTFEENVFIEPKAGLALGNSLSDDETTYLFKKNVYAAGGLMSYGAKAHIAGTLYTDMIFPSFDSIADGTFEDKMVLADDYTEADLERGIGFIWVSDNITYSDIVLKHSAVSMTVSHNLGPVTTNSDGEKEAVCSKCGNVVTVELASDSDSTAAMAKSAVPKKLNKTPDKTDSGSTPGKTDSGTTTPGKTDSGTTTPGKTDSGTTTPGKTDSGNTTPGKTDSGTTTPGKTDSGTATPGKTDPGTTDPGKSGTDTPTVPAVLTGAQIEAEILAMKGEADPKLGRFSALCVTAMPKSKTSVRLKWNAVQGATTYVIYGSKCGKTDAYQRIAATSKTSFIQKKLKKGTYYKYIVVALSKDYVSSVSTTVHVATKGGSVGNVKTVKPRKSKVKIKVGKTSKIKTTVTPQSKKLKVKNHKKLAYESSDPMIATVTGKGVIQGVSAGTCTIYVYAQNGVYKKIQVTVK